MGVIFKGCGVKNAGWRGLYVDGGFAYARGTIWDGAGFASGPEGAACGIRGSNMSVVMAREASAKNSYQGAYFSRASGTLNDADFSGSTAVGIASTDGADVSCSGATVDNALSGGLRVDGGRLFASESSSIDGQFLSALNCGGFALVVQGGGEVRLTSPTLSSTGTTAVQIDTAFAEIQGGDIQTSFANRPAVRMYNGARANLPSCRLEGTTVEIELNGGSDATVFGCLRIDGVSPIRSSIVDSGAASILGSNMQAIFMTGTTTTASGTVAKTVTLDSPWASYAPVAGDFFIITYANLANQNNITLNINGSGARNVRTPSGSQASGSTFMEAGGSAVYRFDGTYYRSIGATQNNTYPEITEADIIDIGHSTQASITGRRIEYLLASEANTARNLTNKTLVAPKISSGGIPGSASSTGAVGQIAWDANYLYVCTATNTWVRSALSTW